MIPYIRVALVLWLAALFSSAQGADEWPSRSYLEKDYQAATLVAHVQVREAKVVSRIGGYENWKLSCRVIEPFKGKLRPGQALDYELGAEAGFKTERFLGERIAFLSIENGPEPGSAVYLALENTTLTYSENRAKKLRSIKQSAQ